MTEKKNQEEIEEASWRLSLSSSILRRWISATARDRMILFKFVRFGVLEATFFSRIWIRRTNGLSGIGVGATVGGKVCGDKTESSNDKVGIGTDCKDPDDNESGDGATDTFRTGVGLRKDGG